MIWFSLDFCVGLSCFLALCGCYFCWFVNCCLGMRRGVCGVWLLVIGAFLCLGVFGFVILICVALVGWVIGIVIS